MLYAVTHTTTYQYTEPVSLCHNLVHLRPRQAPRQTCHHSHMLVQPEPRTLQNQHDYFGNPISLFTIQEPHKKLQIMVKHRIEVSPAEQMFDGTPPWESVRDAVHSDAAILEACSFTFDSQYVRRSAELAEYAAPSFTPGRPIAEAVRELTERIHRDFRYDAKATTLATPLTEVLAHRHGVCQDFSHLGIGCLRSLGLPARYVSGYLRTRTPAGRDRFVGADASHAWLSVFFPEIGWFDFDPTNNMIPSSEHITIAWGRDYDDISPAKGIILGGGEHAMSVAVDVAALS
ncbi:MAG: transglutaminase family protein [Gemmataceae bacterium]|nr:transglutaminase family protein [Gemmataceae bacterium]